MSVAFYCTGRGSHGYAIPQPPYKQYQAAATLRCPVCGLTKQLGYRARQKLEDAGLAEVDISALPF